MLRTKAIVTGALALVSLLIACGPGKGGSADESGFPTCSADTELYRSKLPPGTTSYWCQTSDGVVDGPYRVLQTGAGGEYLFLEGGYSNGIADGPWSWYRENGTNTVVGEFVDGLAHSTWRWYGEDGELNFEAHFAWGTPCGTWTDYNEVREPRVTEELRECNTFDPPEGTTGGPTGERPTGDGWDGQSCPNGLTLAGAAPPDGALAYCTTDAGVRSGPYAEWYQPTPDATPIRTVAGTYTDGARSGDWAWFYNNGAPREAGAFDAGERDGVWQRWTLGGTLSERTTYAAGDRQGSYERWYQNGQLAESGAYADDLRDGQWTSYHRDGGKESEGEYEAGRLTGPWETWDVFGQLFSEGAYQESVAVGTWRFWYYDDGVPAYEEGEIFDGKKHGEWTGWTADGSTQLLEITYFRGLADGLSRVWHPNEQLAAEGRWAAGERVETWTFWHDNGQERATGGYEYGLRQGRWTHWWPNGQKQAEGEYEYGVREGTWTEWDEDGSQTIVEYDEGRRVGGS